MVHAYEASELFMSIGEFIAAVVVAHYTAAQVRKLPEEEKRLGRPLYVIAFSLFLLGCASAVSFAYLILVETLDVQLLQIIYWVLLLLGTGILSSAALMILEWDEIIVFPAMVLLLGIGVAVIYNRIGMDAAIAGILVNINASILYLLPIFLFNYLAYKTRRATSLAIAFGVLMLAVFPLFDVMPPEIQVVLIFLRLVGPALIATAFYMPDLGISLELWGYAGSFAAAGLWFSVVLSLGQFEFIQLAGLTAIAMATVVSFGTAAYTYGRWKDTRTSATLALNLYFLTTSIAQLALVVFQVGLEVATITLYIAIGLYLLSSMFLNLSALLALDWKHFLLLPVMIVLPAFVILVLNFPTLPTAIAGFERIEVLTHIVQLLLPAGMYLLLWRRIRATGSPRRMTALMMAVGIVILLVLFIASAFISVPLETRGFLLFIAYLIMWLGLTGRADRLVKASIGG